MNYLYGGLLASAIAIPIIICFWVRLFYWKNRFYDSGFTVELELATKEEIVAELRSRENESYLILEPKEKKDGLAVITHAINTEPHIILASLKAAHEGMSAAFGVSVEEQQ